MDTEPYLAGILAGIMAVAVVTAILTAVRKKQGRPKPEYDERQMAARGVAYRWAFLTLMLSLAVNTGVEALWGPWAKPGVSAWMLIFLSIGVFIVACVRKDAYFAVAQNPRTYLWLFGAVVLCQIPNFLLQLRSGDLVEDGLLTWNALSPACGVLFGVMFVCMLVHLRLKSARAAKDLSQQQLADMVSVSRQTINAIEKGDYNPTIRLCIAICRALDKTLDQLFWEKEET